jgi:dihydroorotase
MLITGATLPDGRERDVRVEGELIASVETNSEPRTGEPVVDASECRLMPGAIDVHVHFRDPGFPHKETWETGSKSAAAGGVTAVVDQPNTEPPTVDGEAFDEKASRAEAAIVDYGINGGVTDDWEPVELFERPLFALGEVFLADSTGEMGIEPDLFAEAVEAAAARDVPVTVHAEDATKFDEAALRAAGSGTGHDADAGAWSAYRTPEAEVAAIERALEVGAGTDAQLHIAHTSTPGGIDAAAEAGATCEVTPHHLLLSRADLDSLGTYGRMNPPLRSEERREAVYDRVRDGTVDVIATDHAPHTIAEKETAIQDAPSGVPGVETMLPLLLAEARTDRLSYERVRDLTATEPARIFDLERRGRIESGAAADLVLFDPDRVRPIESDDLHSRCGWTPFEGFDAVVPIATFRRGEPIYVAPRATAAVDGLEELAPETGSFTESSGRALRD